MMRLIGEIEMLILDIVFLCSGLLNREFLLMGG